jgi:hypothetical protein
MSSEVTARLIGGANGGAELNELWRDDSLLGSGKGVLYAFMTASGRVVATVDTTGSFSLSQLRGELVPIPTGSTRMTPTVTGDGTTRCSHSRTTSARHRVTSTCGPRTLPPWPRRSR